MIPLFIDTALVVNYKLESPLLGGDFVVSSVERFRGG